jgi:2-methylaconitate cis-trans-isomerase PrpF
MIAAVGPFALMKGLMEAQKDQTTCRVFSQSTGAVFHITM